MTDDEIRNEYQMRPRGAAGRRERWREDRVSEIASCSGAEIRRIEVERDELVDALLKIEELVRAALAKVRP